MQKSYIGTLRSVIIVHVVEMDEYIFPSDSDEIESDFEGNINGNNSDDSSSNDSSGDDPVIGAEPNNLPIERHIVNYHGDHEIETDYELGWEWILGQDEEPAIPPFTGKEGLLVNMDNSEPEDFFNLLFSNDMWDRIARETNNYVASKNNRRGKFFFSLYSR